MDVKKAIEERRAYRSLDPAEITDEIIRDLASAASLSAIFIYSSRLPFRKS